MSWFTFVPGILTLLLLGFTLGWNLGYRAGQRRGTLEAQEVARRAYYDQQRFRGPQ